MNSQSLMMTEFNINLLGRLRQKIYETPSHSSSLNFRRGGSGRDAAVFNGVTVSRTFRAMQTFSV